MSGKRRVGAGAAAGSPQRAGLTSTWSGVHVMRICAMATKDSASLLLELSEMLSEKAHELKQIVSTITEGQAILVLEANLSVRKLLYSTWKSGRKTRVERLASFPVLLHL